MPPMESARSSSPLRYSNALTKFRTQGTVVGCQGDIQLLGAISFLSSAGIRFLPVFHWMSVAFVFQKHPRPVRSRASGYNRRASPLFSALLSVFRVFVTVVLPYFTPPDDSLT